MTTSRFVCKDVLPPRRKSAAWHIMYGGFAGADIHPMRECAVCQSRPILRYVVWWDEELSIQQRAVKKAHVKAFCANHLTEAWKEQAQHPVRLDWVKFLD